MNPNDYIFLSDNVKYWVGCLADIVSFEQDGNYTNIKISNGQKLTMRGVIGKWETKLPPSLFFKTGRDCIINLKHVQVMQAYDAKRFSFVLLGGSEVILSRAQSILFRKSRRLI